MVVAVAATTKVAGCGRTQESSSQLAAISPSAAVGEYQAEEKTLTLAPGTGWPASVAFATTGPDGRGMLYQIGYGTSRADHYWYCSWESALIQAEPSSDAAGVARRQLVTIRDKHMYQADVIPPDRPYFNKVLNTALEGNLRLMKRDVRLNCQGAQ
ncbi:MAG: hypothetical protein QM655_15835 [Nocardioidaceae bacterium]